MKFEFDLGLDKINKITNYLKSEQSFYPEPWSEVDYSILLGSSYLSLDVSLSDMRVKQISGCLPKLKWINKELQLPTVINQGALFVYNSNELNKGTGSDYGKNWITYYDRSKKWICIGNCNLVEYDIALEFSNDCIAMICNNNLMALWIKVLIK